MKEKDANAKRTNPETSRRDFLKAVVTAESLRAQRMKWGVRIFFFLSVERTERKKEHPSGND